MNIVARALPPLVVAAGFIASAKWLVPDDEPIERDCEPSPIGPALGWEEGYHATLDAIRTCYRNWFREELLDDVKIRVVLDRNARALHVAGPSQNVLYCFDPIAKLQIEAKHVLELDVTMSRARLSIAQTEHLHPRVMTYYGGDTTEIERGIRSCLFEARMPYDGFEADRRARARLSVRGGRVQSSTIYAGPESPDLRHCLAAELVAMKFHADPASAEIDVGVAWDDDHVVIDARIVAEHTEIQ